MSYFTISPFRGKPRRRG